MNSYGARGEWVWKRELKTKEIFGVCYKIIVSSQKFQIFLITKAALAASCVDE
jgi:hypothetical protein